MNRLTRQIKDKGYSLPEFCKVIGFSLRWYRTHERKDNKQNAKIRDAINNLGVNQSLTKFRQSQQPFSKYSDPIDDAAIDLRSKHDIVKGSK